MKKYELLFTLPGTLDDNESAQHIEEILTLVKNADQEAKVNNLGKMRLAYPIKQIRYGYFYTIIFQAEESAIPDLNEKLRLRNDLLRFTLNYFNVKAEEAKKAIKHQIARTSVPVSLAEKELIREVGDSTDVTTNTTSETLETVDVEPVATPLEEPIIASQKRDTKKKIDLKDIGDKLDEILNSDIVSGV
jgi:small subunit ribosomal protein S6